MSPPPTAAAAAAGHNNHSDSDGDSTATPDQFLTQPPPSLKTPYTARKKHPNKDDHPQESDEDSSVQVTGTQQKHPKLPEQKELVWITMGKTDHAAFVLGNTPSKVFVQWASDQTKEWLIRSEITLVKDSDMMKRGRRQPKKLTPTMEKGGQRYEDAATATTTNQNSAKKAAAKPSATKASPVAKPSAMKTAAKRKSPESSSSFSEEESMNSNKKRGRPASLSKKATPTKQPKETGKIAVSYKKKTAPVSDGKTKVAYRSSASKKKKESSAASMWESIFSDNDSDDNDSKSDTASLRSANKKRRLSYIGAKQMTTAVDKVEDSVASTDTEGQHIQNVLGPTNGRTSSTKKKTPQSSTTPQTSNTQKYRNKDSSGSSTEGEESGDDKKLPARNIPRRRAEGKDKANDVNNAGDTSESDTNKKMSAVRTFPRRRRAAKRKVVNEEGKQGDGAQSKAAAPTAATGAIAAAASALGNAEMSLDAAANNTETENTTVPDDGMVELSSDDGEDPRDEDFHSSDASASPSDDDTLENVTKPYYDYGEDDIDNDEDELAQKEPLDEVNMGTLLQMVCTR